MTPTEKILAQIQAAQKLSEGATVGPWKHGAPHAPERHPDIPITGSNDHYSGTAEDNCILTDGLPGGADQEVIGSSEWMRGEVADFEFIAASRTLVPRLARQLEEAIKALEKYEGMAIQENESTAVNWAARALEAIANMSEGERSK